MKNEEKYVIKEEMFWCFKPILPTCIIEIMRASEENMHIDTHVGANEGITRVCNFGIGSSLSD